MNPQLYAPHERRRLELLVRHLAVLHPPVAELLPLQHRLSVVGRAVAVGPGHGRQVDSDNVNTTTASAGYSLPSNTASTITLQPADYSPCNYQHREPLKSLWVQPRRSSISGRETGTRMSHCPAGTAGDWPDSGLQGPAHSATRLSAHGSTPYPRPYSFIFA